MPKPPHYDAEPRNRIPTWVGFFRFLFKPTLKNGTLERDRTSMPQDPPVQKEEPVMEVLEVQAALGLQNFSGVDGDGEKVGKIPNPDNKQPPCEFVTWFWAVHFSHQLLIVNR